MLDATLMQNIVHKVVSLVRLQIQSQQDFVSIQNGVRSQMWHSRCLNPG